jgi:hypothetical protein
MHHLHYPDLTSEKLGCLYLKVQQGPVRPHENHSGEKEMMEMAYFVCHQVIFGMERMEWKLVVHKHIENLGKWSIWVQSFEK